MRWLDAGLSRKAAVRLMMRTPAAAAGQARAAYLGLFGRLPTAVEQAYFTGWNARGATTRQLYAGIMGEAQFYRIRGGGTPSGFVTAVYQGLLERIRRPRSRRGGSASSDAGRVGPRSPGRSSARPDAGAADRGRPGELPVVGRPIAAGRGRGAPGRRERRRPRGAGLRLAGIPGERGPVRRDADPAGPRGRHVQCGLWCAGAPVDPFLDFDTRWTRLDAQDGPTIDGTNLISAGSDGSVWVTQGNNERDQLFVYSPGTATTQPSWTALPTLPHMISSLLAVSEDSPAVDGRLSTDENARFSIDGQGNIGNLEQALLRGAGFFSEIAAAADGTILEFFASGALFLYPLGQLRFPMVSPLPTFAIIDTMSIGSESNIWATGTHCALGARGAAIRLGQLGGPTLVPGVSPTHVAAAADGSVWAWDDATILMRSPLTGVWRDWIDDPDPAGRAGGGSASSSFRFVSVLADNTLGRLSFGVIDQQPVPILPSDPDELAAYQAISQYLDAVSPEGIRGDTTARRN